MSYFNISAKDLLNNPDKVFSEQTKFNLLGPLRTSRSLRNVPPIQLTTFNLSEILMRIPAFNSPEKALELHESIVTGTISSFWDENEMLGFSRALPGSIRDALAAANPDGISTVGTTFGGGEEGGGGGASGGAQPSSAGLTNGKQDWGGFQNGRIPQSAMRYVRVGGTKFWFEPNAGVWFERMLNAAKSEGVNITLTGSYRTYERQVSLKREKPNLAATPGRSNHGWGKAIDVANNRVWVQRNGHRYGWLWPDWARPGGSRPEDWHFEFWGPPRSASTNPVEAR